jgi:hypothetical protein
MSSTERVKKYRLNAKENGQMEHIRAKDAAQHKKKYNVQKEITKALPISKQSRIIDKQRNQSKKKVYKWRMHKKENTDLANTSEPFLNRKCFTSAVRKVKKVLPKDKGKSILVLNKLMNELTQEKNVPYSTNYLKKTKMPNDRDVQIINFYNSEEISRISPNRKDFKKFKNLDGTITEKQIRYMNYPITEAHEIHVGDYPDYKCSLSKFFTMRPKHVLIINKTPNNVCTCTVHENVKLALDALFISNRSAFSNVKYSEHFFNQIICKEPSIICYSNKCLHCKNGAIFESLTAGVNNVEQQISWYHWDRNKTAIKNPENSNIPKDFCQIKKSTNNGSTKDLLKYITDLLPAYVLHVYIKRNQCKVFNCLVLEAQKIDSNMAVLQVDFAEKYECGEPDSPQAAHFGRKKISIFTVALWHRKPCQSSAMITDVLQQDRNLIATHFDKIFENIPPTVKTVQIWSDNATSQFKNQYTMKIMEALAVKHSLSIVWNFFAAQHGKGVVDGIGVCKTYCAQ